MPATIRMKNIGATESKIIQVSRVPFVGEKIEDKWVQHVEHFRFGDEIDANVVVSNEHSFVRVDLDTMGGKAAFWNSIKTVEVDEGGESE